MSLIQLYKEQIKSLPVGQRLELAKIILHDIPPESVSDFDTAWSDEDLRDATAYSSNLINENIETAETG
jgi:hypothetical protein